MREHLLSHMLRIMRKRTKYKTLIILLQFWSTVEQRRALNTIEKNKSKNTQEVKTSISPKVQSTFCNAMINAPNNVRMNKKMKMKIKCNIKAKWETEMLCN